jgi:hypothetical protein
MWQGQCRAASGSPSGGDFAESCVVWSISVPARWPAKAALAGNLVIGHSPDMPADPLTEAIFALPERERLELARRIVESVAAERRIGESVSHGVRRIEEVVTGAVRGLSEEEYRQAIG